MQSHGARILPSTHIYIYVYMVHILPLLKFGLDFSACGVMVCCMRCKRLIVWCACSWKNVETPRSKKSFKISKTFKGWFHIPGQLKRLWFGEDPGSDLGAHIWYPMDKPQRTAASEQNCRRDFTLWPQHQPQVSMELNEFRIPIWNRKLGYKL